MEFCKRLCCKKPVQDKGKKDKKSKHGEEKGNKMKIKNVYVHQEDGQGKKNVGQDAYSIFEFTEENVKFQYFGVYDGHGDSGALASQLVAKEAEVRLRRSGKLLIRMKDDIQKVKKFLKQLFNSIQIMYTKDRRKYN